MTKLNAAVTFICDAPAHLDAPGVHGTLTVNGVAWAYCPGTFIRGHEWRPLDPPVEIHELRRDWRRFVDGPRPSARQQDEQQSRRSST